MSDSTSAAGNPPPLDPGRVERLCEAAGLPWGDITIVGSTGSTNADLLTRVGDGRAREGAVIAADEQTAGRGRHGRDWSSPAGTTLSFSVALAVPTPRLPLVPLLGAVAYARAIGDLTGLAVEVKWPNDLLLADAKVAGILAEADPGGSGIAVLGCGVNVALAAAELPVPTATSLGLHGPAPDRNELLVAALSGLAGRLAAWRDSGFDAEFLLAQYRAACSTVGRDVTVAVPDGTILRGVASGIDGAGRLVLATADGESALSAGDVSHVRRVR